MTKKDPLKSRYQECRLLNKRARRLKREQENSNSLISTQIRAKTQLKKSTRWRQKSQARKVATTPKNVRMQRPTRWITKS